MTIVTGGTGCDNKCFGRIIVRGVTATHTVGFEIVTNRSLTVGPIQPVMGNGNRVTDGTDIISVILGDSTIGVIILIVRVYAEIGKVGEPDQRPSILTGNRGIVGNLVRRSTPDHLNILITVDIVAGDA